MAKKDQVKFYARPELVGRFGDVLETQGLTLSEGMTRLMELVLIDPQRLAPILFRQVQGDAAKALAHHVLRQKDDSPADDNISVLLHPERPEQVLKPKKRKTG